MISMKLVFRFLKGRSNGNQLLLAVSIHLRSGDIRQMAQRTLREVVHVGLLQDSLYGFPRLFTVTPEHIRLFTF